MRIIISFDYELYFHESGSAEKCILNPTNALHELAKKHSVSFTYFVDIGYLIKLAEYAPIHENLQKDLEKLTTQIKQLKDDGQEIGLHIHPHWEDTVFENGKWKFDVTRYRLDHFSDEEILKIVTQYKQELENIVGKKIEIYRAGGWCIQPFSKLESCFKELGLKLDSSVFPGGYLQNDHYNIDFTKTPNKDVYRFQNDVCQEEITGDFVEVPISAKQYSAAFYWQLYLLGRLDPKNHKPWGDGYPVPVKGYRKKVLAQGNLQCVSCDGFFASQLKLELQKRHKAGKDVLNVIGHPKALTTFALNQLDAFLSFAKKDHDIVNFQSFL